ncbi:class I SAM-dependent methyltransferase [Flaviramulus sp. BrNp1-15]|uniref:class I SAM-dependent methyltransferase n=1 Tax=Flaviramulus sp. BrNp1-15 TaxID=2916754 RepID=UPI001EE7ED17|nr:class I SAM-dependent methyltransferase [Flaviramulus sp. BrNp1-15]ULC60568.1 class I SAM-dependent methyltransferase [Flaviramulus sp. BrNp1-15]
MKLSRNFTNKFNWILDNLIPPFVRESRVIMSPLFKLIFKSKAKLFLDFKDNAWKFDAQQMTNYYKELADVHIQRETDLNTKSVNYILTKLKGKKILDIACGKGYLANLIQEKCNYQVTGIDFILPENLKGNTNPKFETGVVEQINYPDNYFDTVISTHTLEHVIDLNQCIKELRRVCSKRLIVVLPKQRPYRFTFDLHLHFFPYKFSVMQVFNNNKGECINLDNDWLYIEDS